MSWMIPFQLSREIKSNAERKIFAWFQNAPETDDWVVLYSLGIANHWDLVYLESIETGRKVWKFLMVM
jgi:hypothetical protein